MKHRRLCWLFIVLLPAGCDGPSDPDDNGVAEQNLNILVFTSPDAVPIKQASFWAVRGRDRKLEMDYVGGEDFLEFEVRSNSLLRRPDGTLFQNGDSILITVTLDPA